MPLTGRIERMGLSSRSNSLLSVILLGIFFLSKSVLSESFTGSSDQDNSIGPEEVSDENTPSLEVTIFQGIIKGFNLVTNKNRNILGFTGIPFGKPPVGNLRFSSPEPADPWTGILDATRDSKMCLQLVKWMIVGDEDCLYLDVYTPEIPTDKQAPLLPVMMFAYGRGFLTGSNDFSMLGPGYLLDKDIVLVVPNYRLGALGFLCTGDKESPGNYGPKDLVLALKWIRDNVKFFGGDPDQVTIVGHSAGGISVNYLVLSNSTIGLFHRYITESGPALGFTAHQPRTTAVKNALKVGERLGCPTNTSAALIQCLRNSNASQIVGTILEGQIVPWLPTDEPDIEGALLTDSPANLWAAGKIRDLPSITGLVRNEGLTFASNYYANPEEFENLLANFNDLLPNVLLYYNQVDDVSAYTRAFKEYYFDNDLTTNRSVLISNFTILMSDALFFFPTYKLLQEKLNLHKKSTFLYSFEYRGTFSSTNLVTESLVNIGVDHADELIYLFPQAQSKFQSFGKKMSEDDMRMVDIMVDLWTSFVIDGIPTSFTLNATGSTWEPYSSRNNYLRIGNGSDVSLGVEYISPSLKGKLEFWQHLISTHHSIAYGMSKGGSEDNSKIPPLTIPAGTLQGINLVTRNGRNVSGYLGIPYAKPPIGNLRFKSSEAADPWNGTLNADGDSNVCPQLSSENTVIGDEDCLYLNVYTPKIGMDGGSKLLPVIVFVHPGGFEEGNCASYLYGPGYLLEKDVLLVCPHYRLGVLGFLSMGDEVLPGNYGLKDLVLALKWVQNNIAYFGGNPDLVTAFGQGSGAGAVKLLALSNSTNGLFHRYITQSGAASSIKTFRPNKVYVSRAKQLGKYLKCPRYSSSKLANCLMLRNTSEIVQTKSSFYEWKTFPDTVWGATNEPEIDGALITQNIENLYANGQVPHMSCITGVVKDEGLSLSAKFYVNPDMFEEFLTKFDKVLPYVLQYRYYVKDEKSFTKALKDHYFNDMDADRNVLLANLTEMIGDAFYTFSVYQGLAVDLSYAKSSDYFYSFEYEGTLSNSYDYSNRSTQNFGVAHGDDLIYLFPQQRLSQDQPGKKMSKTDYKMIDTMVSLWTSFASNGKPSAPGLKSRSGWRAHSRENNYLQIGDRQKVLLVTHYFFHSARMHVWKSLHDTNSKNNNSWLSNILSDITTFFNNIWDYVEYILLLILDLVFSWL